MRLLPLLALAGCVKVDSNVDLSDCIPETERVEQTCYEADVRGENNNAPLKTAIDELKSCLGEKVKVVCKDPGLGEPRILAINK